MALTITYVPGYVWTVGEVVTEDKLNLSANPTISLEGSINSTSIADLAVTTAKLATGALSADSVGRSKMADQFLTAAKLGADVAGDGLQGGAGAAIAVKPDLLTIETSGGKVRIKSTGAGVIASARNLTAFNNAGTPNTKVDLSADEILAKDSSSNPYLIPSLSVTVDITASGENGLDTGALASNTWYYLWVIAKVDGTKAGLFSLSATAPTLPAGYVYKALVGVVRSDNSSHFVAFVQQDREIFVTEQVLVGPISGVTSWTAPGTLSSFLPPNAKVAWGNAGNTSNNGGIAVSSDANGLGASLAINGGSIGATTLSFGLGGNWRVALKTAQTIYYIMANTSAGYRVTIAGYRI
jgi:hypothetical protein